MQHFSSVISLKTNSQNILITEERPLGVLVYSFTKSISSEHQQAMRELVFEPAEIAFREVKYTENELIEKQREVDA